MGFLPLVIRHSCNRVTHVCKTSHSSTAKETSHSTHPASQPLVDDGVGYITLIPEPHASSA